MSIMVLVNINKLIHTRLNYFGHQVIIEIKIKFYYHTVHSIVKLYCEKNKK